MRTVSMSNMPRMKVLANTQKIEMQWMKLMTRFRPQLLANMRAVTYLLKTQTAITKLQGQELNKVTGNLIRSLLPNSPEVAGRMVGNAVVGVVGAQGAIAPYARWHEIGAVYSMNVGAGSRGGFGARGGSKLASGSGYHHISSERFSKVNKSMSRYLSWAKKHPATTSTMTIRPRYYIRGTIIEKMPIIKALLGKDLYVI